MLAPRCREPEEKFLELFGNDDESAELTEWFERLQTTALTQTASVQCLGKCQTVTVR